MSGPWRVVPQQRRLLRVRFAWLLAACCAVGCIQQDAFVPPDLFYLFATYQVGKNPTSVTTGDFNEDGVTDLITTNIASDSLSVLFGNGDGTFKDQVKLDLAKEPRSLALGDFNEDGHTDLAVACAGSDQITIVFGLASGHFSLGQRYTVSKTPVSIASADFNGDRNADLAVALRNDKLKIFLGQGNGTFREGVQYEYGDTPTSIAAADLDRDGKMDVVVTNGGPMSSAVSIWLGNGDGTFRKPTDYRTGKSPLGVSFADFNNDYKTDLLVTNGEMDTFTVFLGQGNGAFQAGKESGADAGPVFGVSRDFDGDGALDVAIANVQSSDVSILFGRGDGTFRFPPKHYKTKGGPFALALLPLTTKSTEETGFVVANNGAGSVSIFLHRGLKAKPVAAPPAAS